MTRKACHASPGSRACTVIPSPRSPRHRFLTKSLHSRHSTVCVEGAPLLDGAFLKGPHASGTLRPERHWMTFSLDL